MSALTNLSNVNYGIVVAQQGIINNLQVDTISAISNSIIVDSNIIVNQGSSVAGNFTGNMTGNVTGNVVGSVTGNVLGNVVGNLQGNCTGTSSGFTSNLTGVVIGPQTDNTIANGAITNAMLATLTESGLVSNSATSATSNNTPSTIIARDANGDFSATTITANLNGNATSSTNTTNAVNFTGNLSGVVTGTQSDTIIVNGAITNAMTSAATAATANTIALRDSSANLTTSGLNCQWVNSTRGPSLVGNPIITMSNGSLARWTNGLVNTENGSNTGSDWYLNCFNDAGSAVLSTPIVITRSTGLVNIPTLSVGAFSGLITANGGIMTTSDVTSSQLILTNGVTNNNGYNIIMDNGGLNRWTLGLTNSETGSNVGSDFTISNFNDVGALLFNLFTIKRSTGTASFAKGLTVSGAVLTANAGIIANTITANNSITTAALSVTGNSSLDNLTVSGTLTTSGAISCPSLATTGDLSVGTTLEVGTVATITGALNANGGANVSGNVNLSGDLIFNNPYRTLSMTGGNSLGYIFGSGQLLDNLNFCYNFNYPDSSGTANIFDSALATSRISAGAGLVSLCVGAVNSNPIEYLRVGNGVVTLENSASLIANSITATGITMSGAIGGPDWTISTAGVCIFGNTTVNQLTINSTSTLEGLVTTPNGITSSGVITANAGVTFALGTNSNLKSYSNTSFSCTISGAFSAAVTINYTLIGNTVSLLIPAAQLTLSTSSPSFTLSNWPLEIAPKNGVNIPVILLSGGVSTMCQFNFSSTTVACTVTTLTGANFTGSCGFIQGTCLNYHL